mgnify:CR=1 FL=1
MFSKIIALITTISTIVLSFMLNEEQAKNEKNTHTNLELAKEVADGKITLSKLEGQLQGAKSSIDDRIAANKLLTNTIKNNEANINELKAQIDVLAKTEADLMEKINQLNAESKEQAVKLNSLNQEKATIEQIIKSLKETNEKLMADKEQASKNLIDAQTAHSNDISLKMNAWKEKESKLFLSIETLQNKINEMAEHKEAMVEANTNLSKCEKNIEQYKSDIEFLQSVNTQLSNDLKSQVKDCLIQEDGNKTLIDEISNNPQKTPEVLKLAEIEALHQENIENFKKIQAKGMVWSTTEVVIKNTQKALNQKNIKKANELAKTAKMEIINAEIQSQTKPQFDLLKEVQTEMKNTGKADGQ